MDVDGEGARVHGSEPAPPVILLDTHALLWLDRGHPRSRPLAGWAGRLYLSPASLLEVELLREAGRIRLRRGATPATLAHDDRWLLDSPPSAAWFEAAWPLSWAHDPFDRLLVAHAAHRGWRLATADAELLARLGTNRTIEL
jgi:PIN domain nuclease of toxin-antitoxin system